MLSDYYIYFKAFHIVFMVTWFAGLLYIVRLFIYVREADQKKEPDRSILRNQLLVMSRRLWYIITWPGMVMTAFFGIMLIFANPEVMKNGWFHAKLGFLFLLIAYHVNTGSILKKLQKNLLKSSSQKLRMYNELPTLFLFSIVFLVVLKNTISLVFAIIGVFAVGTGLMLGIQIYKKIRKADI